MTSYSETLRFLYGLQRRGMKFGLRNIQVLLESVGNPHDKFRSIHIAGTNGKGSTAAFLASISMEAGLRTGLYTSPHLVRFTERIRIDGLEISSRRLVLYARRLRPRIESVKATFFEATTCIALQYFADEGVDLAVIETGLGGRLDSTNVLQPLVSVITNVSLEHREYLGNTVTAIAREKAGIIKPGIPCVTASDDERLLSVLKKTSRKKKASLFEARKLVSVNRRSTDSGTVSFRMPDIILRNVRLGLDGLHQVANARLAVATVEILNRSGRWSRIPARAMRRGLIYVRENTGLPGRLETLGRRGQYVVDVAHNPAGTRTLVKALQQKGMNDLIVVFGVMRDKEYVPMLMELSKVARAFVAVAPKVKRALGAARLYRLIRAMGLRSKKGGAVVDGLKVAEALAGASNRVLVTGSHYVAGEAYPVIVRKSA